MTTQSTTSVATSEPPGPPPLQPLHHLDALWLQVAGTLCNLTCSHCFVSCGPGDTRHSLMTRRAVRQAVEEGLALGAREFYFTGGEPFLHPELVEILEDTLQEGPCTVLTNGTLFTGDRLRRLAAAGERARFSLEIRVSLDGYDAATHDAFRGPGSFGRALAGLRAASAAGFLPIVAVTETGDEDALTLRERYAAMLRAAGVPRPRLKLLPLFRLGREATRSRPYRSEESLRGLPAGQLAAANLQCGHCRAVTAAGVFPCPLLVDEPDARMGARLGDALGPAPLGHGACYTCLVTGMTCANG